jgi:predicted ribosome quality control (RQC) complex YloA/Tae2 family protein
MAAESQFASQQKPAGGTATERLDEELDRDEAEAQAAAFATAALGRAKGRLGDAASELNSMISGLLEAGKDEEQLRYAEQVLEQIQPLEGLLERIRKRKQQGDAFAVAA